MTRATPILPLSERLHRARRISVTFGRIYLGAKSNQWVERVLRPRDMKRRWSAFNRESAESIYDGKGAMATLGNATLGAGLGWAGGKVGGWEPGKAALGKIGWGSLSGSATAAGETLIRGGTWEDAWNSAKIGFAAGGAGGMIESAATFGRPPPPDLPTIKIRSGGPRAGYDTPFNPRLRPPEHGGLARAGHESTRLSARRGPRRHRGSLRLSPSLARAPFLKLRYSSLTSNVCVSTTSGSALEPASFSEPVKTSM